MKFKDQLKAGVILDNPIFMQTIGLCPTLATSTSLSNAIGMGVAGDRRSDLLQHCYFRTAPVYPDKVRIAAFITIIAASRYSRSTLLCRRSVPSLASRSACSCR